MALNRNSNVYTVIYATVLTVLVAILLTLAAVGLADKQKANADNEKKQQVLSAVLGKEVTFDNAADKWAELKMDENLLAVNVEGQVILQGKEVFELVAKQQFAKGEVKADAKLPVYCANINDNTYYIMCMYGAGLWDAIWGYIAIDAQGTIAGVSFDHAGETAGLGAKIKDDPDFAKKFIGKKVFVNDAFSPVTVSKKGGDNNVDAITGATKTSDCVSAMILNSLKGYEKYMLSIKPMLLEAVEAPCCASDSAACCADSVNVESVTE